MALQASVSYSYGIAVTTAAGIITVRNYGFFSPTADGDSIKIDWTAHPNAISYQIYRREDNSSPRLLASVAAPAVTFTDNGTITPTTAPPPQNTVPVQYIKLGTLNVVDKYSTRSLRV